MPESIAHYRIGAKLGQGAMGAVYRATDTKLGRDVAIKVLTATVGDGSAGLASIAREAQVLASLNHPNIAAIYGIEDQAIVMELVDGPTLADRIAKGPLPLDEALAIARQIADALAAAHDKGIVHRDLKPGNVKLTPDGTIKLLDFGLATPAVRAAAADETMTMASSSSGIGMIVGTPAYMSPEQARGGLVDKRSDIWAFGVVLYEMLTGSRLFGGDTTTDVIASVVREAPDLAKVPASVRPLLRKCLEKDPKRRLRDVGDAMLLLETASESAAAPPAVAPSRGRTPALLVTIAALALALAALAYVHFREATPTPGVVRFTTTLPANVNFTQNGVFSVSPDGRTIAFPAIGADGVARLWLQPLEALAPKPLAGVEIPRGLDTLFWSPDNRFLAFIDPSRGLVRADVAGGPTQVMATFSGPVAGGSWAPDGTILIGSLTGILKVPGGGGTPVQVTKVDPSRKELAHVGAMLLPDGKHFLYSRGAGPGTRALFVGALDAKPEAQSTTPLLATDYGAVFVPTTSRDQGWLLFVRESTVMAQPFDASTQTLSGDPVTLVEQVGTVNGTAAGAAYYAASSAGTLAYRSGSGVTGARQIAWFLRDGRALGSSAERSRFTNMKVSPDGTRVATSRNESQRQGTTDVWVTDLMRDATIRLTFSSGDAAAVQPTWSPDSKRIVWHVASRAAGAKFYRKAADGSGADELLYSFTGSDPSLTDWTSDGRFLVYSRDGDIFALPIGPATDNTRQPIPVIQTPANENAAYVSPDSRWVAYMSNESGRPEVYVQPFAPGWQAAGQTPTGGKSLISKGALGLPRWRGDGKELVYLGADGTLMAVDVTLTPTFSASTPRQLFPLPKDFLAQSTTPGALADLSRDDQRVFLVMPAPDTSSRAINVVLNWQSALRH
jgi:Tol biopolymer transport system component